MGSDCSSGDVGAGRGRRRRRMGEIMGQKNEERRGEERSKDENIGNHGYIDTLILRIYRIYRGYIGYIGDISTDILEKNISKLKIIKNS